MDSRVRWHVDCVFLSIQILPKWNQFYGLEKIESLFWIDENHTIINQYHHVWNYPRAHFVLCLHGCRDRISREKHQWLLVLLLLPRVRRLRFHHLLELRGGRSIEKRLHRRKLWVLYAIPWWQSAVLLQRSLRRRRHGRVYSVVPKKLKRGNSIKTLYY